MSAFLIFYAPFLVLVLSIIVAFFVAPKDEAVIAIEESALDTTE